jgi:hypothetical protein
LADSRWFDVSTYQLTYEPPPDDWLTEASTTALKLDCETEFGTPSADAGRFDVDRAYRRHPRRTGLLPVTLHGPPVSACPSRWTWCARTRRCDHRGDGHACVTTLWPWLSVTVRVT